LTIQNNQQEVLETAVRWLKAGHSLELVTVARTWGSSPRPPGSIAAVRNDGVIVGSVSGGCVEKQLSETFQGSEHFRSHVHYVDDDQAKRFGLACGGQLELVFEFIREAEELDAILLRLSRRERVKRVLEVGQGKAQLFVAERNESVSWSNNTLVQIFGPSWRLLIVGAGQLGRNTAQFALAVDFEVIVVDPRPTFGTDWNLANVVFLTDSPDDAVAQYALDSRSAVLALSHDPNVDDLALLEALPSDAFYVGALGSTRNYEKRCQRLASLDLTAEAIARLHGPVGLSIGSRTSSEIAVSIVAELILKRNSIQ